MMHYCKVQFWALSYFRVISEKCMLCVSMLSFEVSDISLLQYISHFPPKNTKRITFAHFSFPANAKFDRVIITGTV